MPKVRIHNPGAHNEFLKLSGRPGAPININGADVALIPEGENAGKCIATLKPGPNIVTYEKDVALCLVRNGGEDHPIPDEWITDID